jgi:hypothetical protein
VKTLLTILLLTTSIVHAQDDTLRLHFRYGSKPAKGFKDVEKVWFGGLKGGHVSIEVDGLVLDFLPGRNPLLPHNAKPSGDFRINNGLYWDSTHDNKRTIVSIPISPEQKARLLLLFHDWDKQAPYDYAVFGMRCAAACYDVLSRIDILKPMSRKMNIIRNFYPKLFRKRIYKQARKNNWPVQYFEGRKSRKWERDRGML